VVLICHWAAPWVSPTSGSEKSELVSVGVMATSVAASAGDVLDGVCGDCMAVVVKLL